MQVWSLLLVVYLSNGTQDPAVYNTPGDSMVATEYMQ